MSILVTGSAGFIGKLFMRHWLARMLKQPSLPDIHGFDIAASNEHWQRTFNGNLLQPHEIREALRHFNARIILHLGGMSHAGMANKAPIRCITDNVVGTAHLLAVVKDYRDSLPPDEGAKVRVYIAGTGEEYGTGYQDSGCLFDLHPASIYAGSKAATSQLAHAFSRAYNMQVSILRFANIYGPEQSHDKFIPLITRAIAAGETIQLTARGEQEKDWLFIDDLCHALDQILDHDLTAPVFHFPGTERATLDAVARLIWTSVNNFTMPGHLSQLRKNLLPGAPTPPVIMQQLYPLSEVWSPTTPLKHGIKETVWHTLRALNGEAQDPYVPSVEPMLPFPADPAPLKGVL